MTKTLLLLAATVLTQAQSGDPTGFCDALNAERAQRGLPPVTYDPNAAGTARRNNLAQRVYGLGHHVCEGLGQCAAVGLSGVHAALAAWTGSPSHYAIIYAPNLVSCGFDEVGGCCTVATSQGGYAATAQGQAPVYYAQPQVYCQPRRRCWWRW